jgi:general transcription factor 3C polypeptide 5 (transcription factor C subunit 1)
MNVDEATGELLLVNRSKRLKLDLKYLPHDAASVPQSPPFEPLDDPVLLDLIVELREAMNERPLWTRRALTNRVSHNPGVYLIRRGLQFVGYQFKGGPFRDAIIKFGIDPRTDKKYRLYQTLFFKLYEEEEKVPGMPWHDVRTGYTLTKRSSKKRVNTETHIFDGKSLTLDGKIWQLCDITDPFLAGIINNSPLREEFDSAADGWYSNGAWSKIKAIMKTKLIAIRAQKTVRDEDFKTALECPDIVPGKTSRNIYIPVPDVRLSDAEIQSMREQGMMNTVRGSGLRKRDQKARSRRIRSRVSGPLQKKMGGGRRRNNHQIRVLPSEIWPEVRAEEAVDRLKALGKLGPESEAGRSGTNGAQLGPVGDEGVDIDNGIEYDEDEEESEDMDGDSDAEEGEDESGSGEDEDYDSETTDVVDFPTYYRPPTAQ